MGFDERRTADSGLDFPRTVGLGEPQDKQTGTKQNNFKNKKQSEVSQRRDGRLASLWTADLREPWMAACLREPWMAGWLPPADCRIEGAADGGLAFPGDGGVDLPRTVGLGEP